MKKPEQGLHRSLAGLVAMAVLSAGVPACSSVRPASTSLDPSTLSVVTAGALAAAQEDDPYDRGSRRTDRPLERAPGEGWETSKVRLGFGPGLTDDPDGFQIGLRGDIHVRDDLATGPVAQLSFGDDVKIVAPTWNVKWFFLERSERWKDAPILDRLHPFIDGGVGLAYIEKDDRRGEDEEAGLLLAAGGGFEYELTDSLAVGTSLLLDFLPGNIAGEGFFFSWQIAALTLRL